MKLGCLSGLLRQMMVTGRPRMQPPGHPHPETRVERTFWESSGNGWDATWVTQVSECYGEVLTEVAVRDLAHRSADLGCGPSIQEGGLEGVFQLSGVCTPKSSWESLQRDTGEENFADIWTKWDWTSFHSQWSDRQQTSLFHFRIRVYRLTSPQLGQNQHIIRIYLFP